MLYLVTVGKGTQFIFVEALWFTIVNLLSFETISF